MSLSRSFFPSETDEILHPQFTKALKGFNVEEVEDYVEQAKRRIEVLESHLDRTLEERDHLRHELASVKVDVYRNAGERLAGILRSIDDHVEGIRQQADEDAGHRIAEAQRRAETLRHEAEEQGARTRAEAAGVLEEAQQEAGRVLGALTGRRDELTREIQGLRGVLLSLLERLDVPSEAEAPAVATSEGDEPPVTFEAEEPVVATSEGEEQAASGTEGEGDTGSADWDVHVDIDDAVVDLRDISVDESS